MQINYFNRKLSAEPVCTMVEDDDLGVTIVPNQSIAQFNDAQLDMFCSTLVAAREDMRTVQICRGDIAVAWRQIIKHLSGRTDMCVEREAVAA